MTTARLPLPRLLGDRVFYGWVVVAAVLVALTTSAGLGFYNATVYLRALTQEQGFSLGGASGATAVFFLTSGVAGLPIAGLLARFDPRLTMAGGGVLGALALALLGRVTELWQLYAVYAVFGIGFAASAFVPGTAIVTRWFSRRRALALSVATTGLSVGGILVTPLSAALIARDGLAGASPWFAAAYLLGVVPVTVLFVRGDPAAYGLRPDGDADVSGPAEVTGAPFAQAVRTPLFAGVTVAFLLVFVAQVGGLAHLFNLVSERLDEGVAAAAVSTVAAASFGGRLLGGWVLGRVSLRAFAVYCMAQQALGLLLLAAAAGPELVLAASAVVGLTIGNLLMAHSLLLAEAFGVREFPRIYGLSQLVATIGIASGPAAVGALAQRSGGYGLPIALAAACSLAAAAVIALGRGR